MERLCALELRGVQGLKLLNLAVAATALVCSAALAQQSKTATVAQWQYVKDDDLLHGKVHDRFILDGVYLTPPHLLTKTPSLVIECSGGKVEQNYFNTGAVVVHRDQSQHGMLLIEGRIDGKRRDFLTTGLSTDGLSVFFTRIDLKDVLAAKQVVIGVYEYLGAQVVIRFDMADPDAAPEEGKMTRCTFATRSASGEAASM